MPGCSAIVLVLRETQRGGRHWPLKYAKTLSARWRSDCFVAYHRRGPCFVDWQPVCLTCTSPCTSGLLSVVGPLHSVRSSSQQPPFWTWSCKCSTKCSELDWVSSWLDQLSGRVWSDLGTAVVLAHISGIFIKCPS